MSKTNIEKAYIVRYVGFDYNATDRTFAAGLINELPDEIFACRESAVNRFKEMVAEELKNWDVDNAEIEQCDDLFYIREECPERWTEIQIKCVTIKK